LFGLLQKSAAEWESFRPASIAVDEAEIRNLIEARNGARKARNFQESDRIRDELAKLGVVLHDTKDGTTWEIAR
jgi:cysteinyl-tRNA synthetase